MIRGLEKVAEQSEYFMFARKVLEAEGVPVQVGMNTEEEDSLIARLNASVMIIDGIVSLEVTKTTETSGEATTLFTYLLQSHSVPVRVFLRVTDFPPNKAYSSGAFQIKLSTSSTAEPSVANHLEHIAKEQGLSATYPNV